MFFGSIFLLNLSESRIVCKTQSTLTGIFLVCTDKTATKQPPFYMEKSVYATDQTRWLKSHGVLFVSGGEPLTAKQTFGGNATQRRGPAISQTVAADRLDTRCTASGCAPDVRGATLICGPLVRNDCSCAARNHEPKSHLDTKEITY